MSGVRCVVVCGGVIWCVVLFHGYRVLYNGYRVLFAVVYCGYYVVCVLLCSAVFVVQTKKMNKKEKKN